MKYLKICMMLALAFAPAAGFAGGEDSGAPFAHNRAPLAPKAYAELPLGAIRAQGWLLEMLERQRSRGDRTDGQALSRGHGPA